MIYQLDLVSGKLVPNDPPWVAFTPGAGPRHLAFHPLLQHAYVVNELDSTVTVLAYDPETGSLRPVQSLSTLPDSFDGPNTCADVHVEPGGRFLYGSNRGHDSIAIFAIDQRTGELDPIGHQSTLGETPRNFAIDPSGALLLAANQDTDSIVSFHLDSETGGLTPTGQVTQVSMPVCVKIVSLAP
jgi:6-phosphogluconolactonase